MASVTPMNVSHYLEGKQGSAVRLVIFEDLQCKDCAWLRRKLDETLLPRFGAEVAFEHRDFPLPRHSWARAAAIASRHFHRIEPGLALRFRREILSEFALLTPESLPAWVRGFAERNHHDAAAAIHALDDPELASLVEADYQAGLLRGVSKTPTLILGERTFIERIPLDELKAAIEESLRR